MTDREKLARETYERVGRGVLDAWDIIAEETRERWREGADIAIAYADRRVAEAVAETQELVLRKCGLICAEIRDGYGASLDAEEEAAFAAADNCVQALAEITVAELSALSPARQGGQGDE